MGKYGIWAEKNIFPQKDSEKDSQTDVGIQNQCVRNSKTANFIDLLSF